MKITKRMLVLILLFILFNLINTQSLFSQTEDYAFHIMYSLFLPREIGSGREGLALFHISNTSSLDIYDLKLQPVSGMNVHIGRENLETAGDVFSGQTVTIDTFLFDLTGSCNQGEMELVLQFKNASGETIIMQVTALEIMGDEDE